MPTIRDALDLISKLSTSDQASLKHILLRASATATTMNDFLSNKRFSSGRTCVVCEKTHVVRNGKRADGTQRYKCKDCGRSFVAASNSIVSGTHKEFVTWQKYTECMMQGMSIRKTAIVCGINRNTAFIWRHKILDALQNMTESVKLDGIVEADETFFPISYKGNHSKSKRFTMPRSAHKRGHTTHLSGLSRDKVCVPCAVNRNGLSIAKVANLGRVSTKDLHNVFDGRIKAGATLCTDIMNSYRKFASKNGIHLVQLKSGKSKKVYSIFSTSIVIIVS